MDTSQLEKHGRSIEQNINKNNKHLCVKKTFLGVVPADYLTWAIRQHHKKSPRNRSHGAVSNSKPPRKSGLIINTHRGNQPGQHWVAMYFTDHGTCEFFDSYGGTPSQYNKSWTRWINKNCNGLRCNRKVVQNPMSSACGAHCLFFLYNRFRNVTMSHIIKKLYTRDDFITNDKIAETEVENFLNTDIVIDQDLLPAIQNCLPFKNKIK